MRHTLSVKLFIPMLMLIALGACKDGGKGLRPVVTGGSSEVLVVMSKNLWEGAVGDSVKQYFSQDLQGFPQSELAFDLVNLPPAMFEKNVKAHRAVLVVEISSTIDSAKMSYINSPWAETQEYFKLQAPDVATFNVLFDENKAKIMSVFLRAERTRLTDVYKKSAESSIYNLFKNKYNLLLSCPTGYRINKDSANLVWVSQETQKDSRGIIFFEEPYTDASELNYQIIMDRVNEVLKQNIPGPLKNSYMTLNMLVSPLVNTYNYQGEYYAVILKGLWEVENDFMGGPYVLNVVLDSERNRVIYMMGYVYAPEEKKRNMMRQVESAIFTMDFIKKEVPATKDSL